MGEEQRGVVCEFGVKAIGDPFRHVKEQRPDTVH